MRDKSAPAQGTVMQKAPTPYIGAHIVGLLVLFGLYGALKGVVQWWGSNHFSSTIPLNQSIWLGPGVITIFVWIAAYAMIGLVCGFTYNVIARRI
jgi:hypothetical protein